MGDVAREQGAAVEDLAAKLDNAALFYREREKWTKECEGFASAQAPLFASIATLFEVSASQERRIADQERRIKVLEPCPNVFGDGSHKWESPDGKGCACGVTK